MTAPRFKTWRCKSCLTVHDNMRLRKCQACGKARAKKREPKHRAVLRTLDYDWFVTRYGELCGICGAQPKPGGKRLHRDHEHKGNGRPRGLLCFSCNSRLDYRSTPGWHRAAADYLERADCACGEINTRHCPVHQEAA